MNRMQCFLPAPSLFGRAVSASAGRQYGRGFRTIVIVELPHRARATDATRGHSGASVYRPVRHESNAAFLPAPLLFGHVVSASAGAARRVRIPHYRAYRASRAEQGRPMRYAGHGGISVYRLVRHESDAVFLLAPSLFGRAVSASAGRHVCNGRYFSSSLQSV